MHEEILLPGGGVGRRSPSGDADVEFEAVAGLQI